MELPLQPAVDVYQIHRTPFFRRLQCNDPNQFERLKKAYESIRSFDKKPLQIQIKKVRLGKLLRRIKNSLTISKSGAENKPRPRKKSKQQIHCEELARARQVGIEYSRQNCNSTPIESEQKNLHEEELLTKISQLKRRLDYGNNKSQLNRSKMHRIQAQGGRFNVFSTISRVSTSEMREKLRKLLVHYLSEGRLNPDVIRSFEEIVKTRNHLYWDLMEAIKKQQKYIQRYGKFTERLSNFALSNAEDNKKSQSEIFKSKTNIRGGSSEVFIRTYRYSDEDEYLPPPSESLLRIPPDLPDATDEIPMGDDFIKSIEERNYSIKHLHITVPNLPTNNIEYLAQRIEAPEKRFDFSQKFGEIIRKTARKESAIMLYKLEKAMNH